jgi:hypothetical protein
MPDDLSRNSLDMVKETLSQARDRLQSESGGIQIQGRALSAEELELVRGMDKARELIDEAITILNELPGTDQRKQTW